MSIRDTSYVDSYIKRLKKLWRGNPNYSLGQLIASTMNYQQIFYYSDEEFMHVLESAYLKIAEENLAKSKKANSGGKSN